MSTIIPKNYKALLSKEETEVAIKKIKTHFEENLKYDMDLLRITAPLFVESGLGINDDLNGIEAPVSFKVKHMNNAKLEIVQSLAKWKRLQLKKLKIPVNRGIVTDMNAIRPDEELDNIHSIYVDQWDCERVIDVKDRNLEFLKSIVKKIYHAIYKTEEYICSEYSVLHRKLPPKITFLHTEDLEKEFPDKTPVERENIAAEKHKAICVVGIGHPLPLSKMAHDGRAPDYDDWSSETEPGYHGLNCDIVVWNDVLKNRIELSSMGIRVSPESLKRQLKLKNAEERESFYFHKLLLNGELPYTIGGGIGQSRLCQFYLEKAHIGEVQASVWPEEMRKELTVNGIFLL